MSVEEREVVITASIWECADYSPPEADRGVKLLKNVVVVIAPINVEQIHGRTAVGWACSLGTNCGNARCRYAKG